jgi:hypothetical protein
MRKAFYIFGEYLCNLTVIASFFMVAYIGYLCYHVLLFWFRNVK